MNTSLTTATVSRPTDTTTKRRTYRRRTRTGSERRNKPTQGNTGPRDPQQTNGTTTKPAIGINPCLFSVPCWLPSCWTLQTTIHVLVHHLLYSRGLFPLPVHQVLMLSSSQDAQEQPQKQSPSAVRKLKSALNTIQALDWQRVIPQGATYVVLTLGPSWSRPVEHYVVDATELTAAYAPPLDDSEVSGNTFATTTNDENRPLPSVHSFARRLLATWINDQHEGQHQDLQPAPNRAASFQMWITVRVDSATRESLWQKQQHQQEGHSLHMGSSDDAASVANTMDPASNKTANNWVPRPDFQLDKIGPKRNQRVYTIALVKKTDSALPHSDSARTAEGEHWLTWGSSIRGFRI